MYKYTMYNEMWRYKILKKWKTLNLIIDKYSEIRSSNLKTHPVYINMKANTFLFKRWNSILNLL